jgi:hypothetical protein
MHETARVLQQPLERTVMQQTAAMRAHKLHAKDNNYCAGHINVKTALIWRNLPIQNIPVPRVCIHACIHVSIQGPNW